MIRLRLVACGIVFLFLSTSSGSTEPDFNVTKIDVDWQLASFLLPPDLEPITTSTILEIASLPRALKGRSTYPPDIAEMAAANGVPPALVDAVVLPTGRWQPVSRTDEILRRVRLRQDERSKRRVLPKSSLAPRGRGDRIRNSSWTAPEAGDPHAPPG
jgi:hypothetical protein